jgi:hypothetical protein
MFTSLLAVFLLLAPTTVDAFKKEMAPLQSAVDALITSTGAQVIQRSHAIYLEGYGIVVSTEIVLERPQGIFDSPKPPAELRSLITQRRKDLQDKLTAFVKERIVRTESIGPTDSLTIVIHVLNSNPVELPTLPVQLQVTVKKDAPLEVKPREF